VAAARNDVPHRWRKLVLPAAVAGTFVTAAVALHVRDPHEQGTWGMCPTKALLGVECPGCGGLRAVNDLTNLQLLDAASSNLLFVASIPFLAYMFGRWVWGRWTGRSWSPSDRSMTWSAVVLIALMVLFTVVRNTTAGAWLAP
jgi:hypothetical protein